HRQLVEVIADGFGDETGGNGRAVIMQDRHKSYRIDPAFVDDQRAQLRVAVLFHHEDEVVVGNEAVDARVEGEGTPAQTIQCVPTRFDHRERRVHRGRARAIVDHAVFRRLSGGRDQGPRYEVLSGLELADQTLHVVDVGRAFFSVTRIAIARSAAGEERAFG